MFSIDALSNRDLESRHEALDDSSIQFSRVRSNRTKIVVAIVAIRRRKRFDLIPI